MPFLNLKALLRRRQRVAAVAATLLATGGLAALAPASMANTYHHASLGYRGAANHYGLSVSADSQGRGYVSAGAAAYGAEGTWGMGGRAAFYAPENTTFRYDTPANTSIQALTWTEETSGLAGGDWNLLVVDGSGNIIHAVVPTGNIAAALNAPAPGSHVRFIFQCGGPNPCYANGGRFLLHDLDVALQDSYSPNVGAASGSLASDAKLTGTEHLAIPASDAGSGLYRVLVYDGSTLIAAPVVSSNDGHCVDITGTRYFDSPVPCLLSATAAVSVNTAALADGNHTLKAYVEDAAGNQTLAWGPTTKLVANHPPVNTARPEVTEATRGVFAAPRPAQTITFADKGTWTGPSLTTSVAWMRCDVNGANCVQIPGATTLSRATTPEDLGHTLRLASTATNAADSVTVMSDPSGVVTAPAPPNNGSGGGTGGDGSNGGNGSNGSNGGGGANGANGSNGANGVNGAGISVILPGLTASTNLITTHAVQGRIAGEAPGVACPADRATLLFQHVSGGQVVLGHGKASTAQLELTCTQTGKAITGAKLEIATKTGAQAAVASDVTTDGAGHATINLGKGASRGVTVGYRMYSDDSVARATATLKVLVKGRVSLRASRRQLRNGQAVKLRGAVAGGLVPKRGVTIAVQWKDGGRWRPFAQVRTTADGRFAYAYKFTRTGRRVTYQLRVQITRGQVDYPYLSVSSKTVRVTVAP